MLLTLWWVFQFLLQNGEDQNLLYQSPFNFRALPTSGRGPLFYLIGYASKEGRESPFQPLVTFI